MPDRDEQRLTDADVVAPLPEPEGEGVGEGAPAPARVKIAGKDFVVDPELAQALQEREGDFARKLSAQGEELGQLRTTVGNLMTTVSGGGASRPTTEGETDEAFYEKYRTLSYEDPSAAARLLEERLTGRYTADQARRQYRENWGRRLDRFYKDNPDLDGEDMLVDATFKEMAPKLRGLSTDEILVKVADESRLRIHRLITKFGKGKGEPPKPTSQGGRMAVVEGGGSVRTGGRAEEPEEDTSPKTMTEAIRRKQARHHGATASGGPVPSRKRRS